MKSMKRNYNKVVITLFLNIIIFFPFFVKAEVNYQLLGLGDSITTGYGITDFNNIYINIFKNYLEEYYQSIIILNNEANNGLTSTQLLNKIKNDIDLKNKIKKADIIVMSIGGNDYLSEIIYYQNPEIFIDIGNQLLANLKDIYNNIFSLNESVILIVIPLYNPYLSLLKNNQELIEMYDKTKKEMIEQINQYRVINNKQIYTSDTLSKEIESSNNLNYGIDPHPNINGHKLIAEECIKIFNEKIVTNNNSNQNKIITFIIKNKYYFIVIGIIFLAYLFKKGYNKARKW